MHTRLLRVQPHRRKQGTPKNERNSLRDNCSVMPSPFISSIANLIPFGCLRVSSFDLINCLKQFFNKTLAVYFRHHMMASVGLQPSSGDGLVLFGPRKHPLKCLQSYLLLTCFVLFNIPTAKPKSSFGSW